MSIWTLADILLWVALAAPWVLGSCGLLLAALIARRVYRALVAAANRLAVLLQESPLAAPDLLGDDADVQHDYADEHAEMWWRSHAIDSAPLIPTRPGPEDATYQALEAIYARPARTEENQ